MSKSKKICEVCKVEIPQEDDYCSPECKEKDKKPVKWYDHVIDLLTGWF